MKTTEIASKVAVAGLLVLGLSDVNHTEAVASNLSSVYNRNINNIIYINKKNNNINKINKDINKRLQDSQRATRSSVFHVKLRKVMYGIKMHESHGNYKADSKWSSACGAYQYITSTWNDYKGYSTACKAPRAVQDMRMQRDLLIRYEKYGGDWKKMIAAHLYPAWANDKFLWNRNIPGNPTLNEYVNGVLQYAKI